MNRLIPVPKAQKALDLVNAYLKAMNEGDTQSMGVKLAADFKLDFVYGDASGDKPLSREETLHFWKTWFEAFPQGYFEATRTIVAENVVTIQWTYTGTHENPLKEPLSTPPLAPTGKTISIRSVSFYDIRDNLIQTDTTYLDLATVFVELGVTP